MRQYFHRRAVLKALFTSVAGAIIFSKTGALAQGNPLTFAALSTDATRAMTFDGQAMRVWDLARAMMRATPSPHRRMANWSSSVPRAGFKQSSR